MIDRSHLPTPVPVHLQEQFTGICRIFELAWHDGNGHSHVRAALLGPSLTVPFVNGDLTLGTWQQIFHLECDVKPRRRTIVVTVMGD